MTTLLKERKNAPKDISNMTISEKQLKTIGDYLKSRFHEWQTERPQYDPSLIERMVRVEEELKHQRELMLQGFSRMDERFAQVDKRFEMMQENMDKRFEQVDKRFEQVEKRFEQVDRHLDHLMRRIDRFMIWSFAITTTIASIAVSIVIFVQK